MGSQNPTLDVVNANDVQAAISNAKRAGFIIGARVRVKATNEEGVIQLFNNLKKPGLIKTGDKAPIVLTINQTKVYSTQELELI